jgi:phage tail-like protein
MSRLPLFQRLPEIYRLRDVEQTPPGQLEAFVGVIDEVAQAIHDDIDALYQDLFIETCAPWVIPYIADLLGTSHLSGDPHDLRADVARTVRNRRRKGTLGAVESVVHALSGWAVHAVELRDRLLWEQHLNHQRPDAGGVPPLSLAASIAAPARGGSVTLRDPALLSLLGGPFDPFGHSVDLKPPLHGETGYNLPNLAIFLWRLKSYRPAVTKPVFRAIANLGPAAPGDALFAVRFDLHPMGEPMVLFNSHRYRADDDPPNLAGEDAVPGPMPPARLTADSPAGRPDAYVEVATYPDPPPPPAPGSAAVGLVLHLPATPFAGASWRLRGANLCAWEAGLRPKLRAHEIVVDPLRGRVLFGAIGADQTVEAERLRDKLLVSASTGFTGPTGAWPIGRDALPTQWAEGAPLVRRVNFHADPNGLRKALDLLPTLTQPLIVEIGDSMTHDLDLSLVAGIGTEGGASVLRLARSLWIRAASGQRPVIRLARPLGFRPDDLDRQLLTARLEGLYLTRGAGFAAGAALIERAALDRLEIAGCTLDPGGFLRLDGTRAPLRAGLRLADGYGFALPAEAARFAQTPEIRLEQSIAGPLAIDPGYRLTTVGSIVDAGSGVGVNPAALALGAATGDPELGWGPDLTVDGLTCFGRMRPFRATGQGGLWVARLEVHDNQSGCLAHCYFSGDHDRLPPNHDCVFGPGPRLRFSGESFGLPGYAQLTTCTDRRIREGGPGADEIGAFGPLGLAHKTKNIAIRLREFMPIGVRPVLVPVT